MDSTGLYRRFAALLLIMLAASLALLLLIPPFPSEECPDGAGCELYIPTLGSDFAGTDINSAGVFELSALFSSSAEGIISMRQALGSFSTTEQLMQVRGIGLKTFLNKEQYIKLSR